MNCIRMYLRNNDSIEMIKELLKKTFLYKKYREKKDARHVERLNAVNEAFKNEAVDVLRLYSNAMTSNGLVFWLDYGTLLGYYREHDFIKHDFDLDTSAWYDDHERIKEALEKAGFERVRHYYLKNRDGLEECYKHKDFQTTIDVFYYFNEGDKSYCFSFLPLVTMTKKRHLNKVQPSKVRKWTFTRIIPKPAEFKGIKVYVPDNTGAYLASTYGDTYMTPIPHYPMAGRPNMTEFTYEEMPACAFLKVGYM